MVGHRNEPRVIVGIHDSPAGLCALRQAAIEARRRGAVLYAVRAFALPSQPYRIGGHECWRHAANQAEGFVRQAFATAMGGSPTDLAMKIVTTEDRPGPALISYAVDEDNLIVVGASRRRRLAGRVRVARYCLSRAACPVLVVPAPELARGGSPRSLTRAVRREADRITRQVPTQVQDSSRRRR